MTPSEKYYQRWVRAAAKRTPLKEIEAHLIRHAKDLNDPTRNLPLSWAASMHNLLAMYESKTGAKVRVGHKLYKFGKKFVNFRGNKLPWLVGPPGGKIPTTVEIKYCRAGTKKRKGDAHVSAAKVRQSNT